MHDGAVGENTPFACPMTGQQVGRENFLVHYEAELRRALKQDIGDSLEAYLEEEVKAMMQRANKGEKLVETEWLKYRPAAAARH